MINDISNSGMPIRGRSSAPAAQGGAGAHEAEAQAPAPQAEKPDSFQRARDMEENLKTGMKKLRKGAAKAVDFLEDHLKVKTALDASFKVLKAIKAFPKFIYPTVHGMKPEEADFVLDTLDKLPLKDVNSVKDIAVLESIPGASGYAVRLAPSPYIRLSREEISLSEKWFREVTIHEVGHTKDFDSGWFGLIGFESKGSPWGKGPHISEYSKTNHWEDFAESYANYHLNPEKLKAQCPEKFAKIKELEAQGFTERLIDTPAFRETGKFMGKIFTRAPYIRTALQFATFLMGFVQAYKGIGEIEKGVTTGDAKMKMDGALDLAAGTCFASKVFSVVGLAIDGAKMELDRAIEKKEITAAQGNAVAQATVGVVTGPLSKALHWVMSKLPWHKPTAGQPPAPPATPPSPGEPANIGSLTKAAGIAIGGATGTTAGGFIGPYAGVLAGFAVAGPIGGAIGLVAGALAGVYAGSRIGGKLGGLIGGAIDKAAKRVVDGPKPEPGKPAQEPVPMEEAKSGTKAPPTRRA